MDLTSPVPRSGVRAVPLAVEGAAPPPPTIEIIVGGIADLSDDLVQKLLDLCGTEACIAWNRPAAGGQSGMCTFRGPAAAVCAFRALNGLEIHEQEGLQSSSSSSSSSSSLSQLSRARCKIALKVTQNVGTRLKDYERNLQSGRTKWHLDFRQHIEKVRQDAKRLLRQASTRWQGGPSSVTANALSSSWLLPGLLAVARAMLAQNLYTIERSKFGELWANVRTKLPRAHAAPENAKKLMQSAGVSLFFTARCVRGDSSLRSDTISLTAHAIQRLASGCVSR